MSPTTHTHIHDMFTKLFHSFSYQSFTVICPYTLNGPFNLEMRRSSCLSPISPPPSWSHKKILQSVYPWWTSSVVSIVSLRIPTGLGLGAEPLCVGMVLAHRVENLGDQHGCSYGYAIPQHHCSSLLSVQIRSSCWQNISSCSSRSVRYTQTRWSAHLWSNSRFASHEKGRGSCQTAWMEAPGFVVWVWR